MEQASAPFGRPVTNGPRFIHGAGPLADSPDVKASTAFVDLLDRELRMFQAAGAASERRSEIHSAPMTAALFGRPRFDFRSTPYAAMAQPRPKPLRTPLALTAAQRHALAAFNEMGADLDDTMSANEMRSAFRRLAQQCHPDRHPGSSSADQARLSRQFATLTDHRRCLAAALERGGRTQ